MIANRKLSITPNSLVLIAIGVLLILVAGLRPIGIDRDSSNYLNYLNVNITEVNFINMEPAFWVLNEVNKFLFGGNGQTFFLMFAIIGVTLKILAIRKLSLLPFFSIFTYMCLYFVLHEMTQIRAGVATAIFLLAIPDIYNRNLILFILKTSLAITFHYSAIFMLPVYFLSASRLNVKAYLLLPLLGIFSIAVSFDIVEILNSFLFLLPEFLVYRIEMYTSLLNKGDEVNIYNVYYVSLLIFYYIIIVNYRYFKSKYDVLLLKIFGLMLFSFYFLSAVPAFAFRISEFFGVVLIILIPHFVLTFKQKTIMTMPLTIWLSVYFIFIMMFQILNIKV